VKCSVIEGLGHDMILGSPWLKTEQALMDYGHSCLYLGMRDRQIVYWASTQTHKSKVESPELKECQPVELGRPLASIAEQEQTKVETPERKLHPGGLRWLIDQSRKSRAGKEVVKLELSSSLGARDNRKKSFPKNGVIFEKIACAQNNVPYIQQIKKSIKSVELNGARTVSQAKRARRFGVTGNLLWRKTMDRDGLERDRLVVPHEFVKQLITAYHNDPEKAPLNSSDTYEQLAQEYYWGYMRRDVDEYVGSCVCCGSLGLAKQTPSNKAKDSKAKASKPKKKRNQEELPVASQEGDKVNVSRKVTQTFTDSWDCSRRVMRNKKGTVEDRSTCAIGAELNVFKKLPRNLDSQAITERGVVPAQVTKVAQGHKVTRLKRRVRNSKENIDTDKRAKTAVKRILSQAGSTGASWEVEVRPGTPAQERARHKRCLA
jgi:hypothetical protein